MGREARANAFEKSQQKPPADVPMTQTALARQEANNWARLVSPIGQNILFAYVGAQGTLLDLTEEDMDRLSEKAMKLAGSYVNALEAAHGEKEKSVNEELHASAVKAGLVLPDKDLSEPHMTPGALDKHLQ